MVIAHRGAWRACALPQNSLAALRQARMLGCGGCECDVHLSADNLLVVAHDADWGGLPIATTDYARLRQHRLANGETLPLLADFLREVMQGKTVEGSRAKAIARPDSADFKLVIELKDSALGQARTQEAVGLLLGEVAAAAARQQVEYILFNYRAAQLLIATDPAAHVSYLEGDVSPEQLRADGFAGLDYPLETLLERPQWLAQAARLGLATNAWTVNCRAAMRQLLALGAERITTDEPELLQALLAGSE